MPQYHLHLKGFVGGADFDRNYVDYILSRNVGKPVSVLIDSLGGNLATALSITSAFRRHSDVSVHFTGMNASAATIASLGARHISIDANAMYLVHKCSTPFFEWASLNSDQLKDLAASLEKEADNLDKLDANVASMYAAKCKKDPKALLDLMKAGDWLTAKEAIDWGFVDEITDAPEDAAPKLTDATASAMAAAGMPIPNVPVADVEKDSAFGKFLAAIASFFRPQAISNPNPHNQMANLTLPLICAVLDCESLAVSAEGTSVLLEISAMTNLELALAQRDKSVADLTAQVAEKQSALDAANAKVAELQAKIDALEKHPAAQTQAIVNPVSATATETSPSADLSFADHYNQALADFRLLP